MTRPPDLQSFLDAAVGVLGGALSDPAQMSAFGLIHKALELPGQFPDPAGSRLPVCEHLARAADPGRQDAPALQHLLARFQAIEPLLTWTRRAGGLTNASASFPDGHANAIIVGPNGLEQRTDVWLGVSLMAPDVRYPDHSHPPEEIYLALSDGAFRHGEDDWVEPGAGGTFHNPPRIRHTMRSRADPLLALWFLLDRNVSAG
ncbi:dimethylsulfonioproprionate lyase family protein [Roseibium sp. AS2]|uniref:dimethylsulfonioproprionate lyase family protein n=1 Tax=Roseibium sp. AS2 TaxID=3135781 RepID=UPI003171BB5A